jgi:hypothetical protein
MPHPALPSIEAGLTASNAALLRGDLDAMQTHLVRTLDALAEVTRDGFVPRQQRDGGPAWDAHVAEALVWDLLSRLKQAGCSCFAYAGTLLGLQRDGRLLPNDKDADLAVWLEDYALACRVLGELGLRRATDVPPFANMATFVEPASGYSVDLFGIHRDPLHGGLQGGVWLHGKPASHQRVLRLPWLDLVEHAGPKGTVWWPQPADALLTALYGDWRTPNPEWDSLVSCLALQETNLSWRCWALRALRDRWLTGDLARARRLCDQIGARARDWAELARYRDALDAGLALQAAQAGRTA